MSRTDDGIAPLGAPKHPVPPSLGGWQSFGEWIEYPLALAALAVLACAVIGTADVLSTWLLRRSILGVLELLQMLMVVIIFLGLASSVWRGENISVDLFRAALPKAVQRVGDLVSLAITTVVLALIAYGGVVAALKSWDVGEFANGPVPFPIFPARIALTAGAWLAAAAACALLIQWVSTHRKKR